MKKLILATQCAIMFAAVSSVQANAFELKPKGELQFDYATHDADVRPLDDDGIVRRAELGVEGKISSDWSFELVYDFADGGEFNDAYIEYGGWKLGDISVGQFKPPFGLDKQISSSDTMFIERALPIDAFTLSRRVGVGFTRAEDNYTATIMAFGSSIEGDEGPGIAARYTYTPINNDKNVVHLGIAAAVDNPEDTVNLRTYPESQPTDVRFVRTGRLEDVDRISRLGLEFAWKSGPYSAQAEWLRANVDSNVDSDNGNFDGWYVSGSWILTGESREYKKGRFRGVKPNGKLGAWELAARYSSIDLNDDEVQGGQENNVTLGLNWYVNDHFRFSGNYIKVDSERRGISDDPNIFLVRAQATF